MSLKTILCPAKGVSTKGLQAEYLSLQKIFRNAKEYELSGGRAEDIPAHYMDGAHGELFFYNKLRFILYRFKEVVQELAARELEPAFSDAPMWWLDYIHPDFWMEWTPPKHNQQAKVYPLKRKKINKGK